MVLAFLTDLEAQGISFDLDGDRLRVSGKRILTGAEREAVSTHKTAIIEELSERRAQRDEQTDLFMFFHNDLATGGPNTHLWPQVRAFLSRELPAALFQELESLAQTAGAKSAKTSSHWTDLLASGQTDLDVTDLDDALFLYAAGSLRDSADPQEIWDRSQSTWRTRLHPGAFLELSRLLQELKETKATDNGPVQTPMWGLN